MGRGRLMKVWVIGRHYPSIENRMRGSFELEQAKMLARGGCDVTYVAVIYHYRNNIKKWGFTRWEEDGITICGYSQLYFPERFNIQLTSFKSYIFKKAINLVQKEVGLPDIVHIHYPSMIGESETILALQEKGCRIVCTEHWTSVLTKRLSNYQLSNLKSYVNRANGFICVSEPLKKAVIDLTQTKKKVTVIPNVVESLFEPSYLNKKNDLFKFICVGRLVKVKQYDKTIEAFNILFKKRKDIYLTIVGDGNERNRLHKQVIELGLKEYVHFTGSKTRNEVAELMRQSDCLICYSSLETFGVPIIEAWASGIPVIASSALGFAEYWKEGLGYIVNQDDIKALANKMDEIISMPVDKRKLSEYSTVQFGENVVCKSIQNFYEFLNKN